MLHNPIKTALLVILFILLAFAAPVARQTTLKVYSGGTSGSGDATYTNSQLQNALNDAEPGDTILLEEGHEYSGNFVLPTAISCAANDETCYITLKTGVDASGNVLDSSEFPAENIRITTSHLATLAKLTSPDNNGVSLRTVFPGECGSPPCISKWWKIEHIAFKGNVYGGSILMHIGYWDISYAGTGNQDTKAKSPDHFLLNQNIFYGNPVTGQHRCLTVSAKNVQITNNYFKDCKTNRNDGQAIALANAVGPVSIVNNYIEGSTENIIIGGFDGIARQSTTVSSAASASEFTLGHVTELDVNQWIGVGGPDPADEQSAKVTSIVGTTITVSPALESTPSNGTNVRWSLHTGSVTVQKNHIKKPIEWSQPVVATPGTPSITATTGGSLANGTYYYRVVAWHNVNEATPFRSTASAESSCVLSGGNNACQIQWAASANVTATYTGAYLVYGRAQGAQDIYFSVTPSDAGCSAGTGTCSFTDIGGGGTSEAVPTTPGNLWSVKNLFETKECGALPDTNCLIEGNLFEQSWFQAPGNQGAAIVLHLLQEGDRSPSVVTRNVTFRNNKVRLASSAMSIASSDTQNLPSGLAENITIQNNLFYQLGVDQGQYYQTLNLGSGSFRPQMCGRNLNAGKNFTIDHNTFISTSANRGYLVAHSANESACQELWTYENLKVKNNIFIHGNDGEGNGFGFNYLNVNGAYSSPNGNNTWAAISSGASAEWMNNVVRGANPAWYTNCVDCIIPDVPTFEAGFVDYDGENYRLVGGSSWDASDGGDIGANIDTIEAWTNIALSGDNSGSDASTPFGGTPAAISGTLELENYDEGGSGVAYLDNSPTNEGGEYRLGEEVDISTTTDQGGGYVLSFVGAGEWTQYTVNVSQTKNYTLQFRVGHGVGAGGTFHLEVNGEDVTGPISVPDTGDWDAYTTVTAPNVSLTEGEQIWRLVFDTASPTTAAVGNFNFLNVVGGGVTFRLRIKG